MKVILLVLIILISSLNSGRTSDETIIDNAFWANAVFEGESVRHQSKIVGRKKQNHKGAVFKINRIFKGEGLLKDSVFITNYNYSYIDSLGNKMGVGFGCRTIFKANKKYLIFAKKIEIDGDSAWRDYRDYKIDQEDWPFNYDQAAKILEKAMPLINKYPQSLIDSITNKIQYWSDRVKTYPFNRVHRAVYKLLNEKDKSIVKKRYKLKE